MTVCWVYISLSPIQGLFFSISLMILTILKKKAKGTAKSLTADNDKQPPHFLSTVDWTRIQKTWVLGPTFLQSSHILLRLDTLVLHTLIKQGYWSTWPVGLLDSGILKSWFSQYQLRIPQGEIKPWCPYWPPGHASSKSLLPSKFLLRRKNNYVSHLGSGKRQGVANDRIKESLRQVPQTFYFPWIRKCFWVTLAERASLSGSDASVLTPLPSEYLPFFLFSLLLFFFFMPLLSPWLLQFPLTVLFMRLHFIIYSYYCAYSYLQKHPHSF